MKKPPEMVPADKSVRLNFYLAVASYILLTISLEQIIDFILLAGLDQNDAEAIAVMNKRKVIIANMAFTVIRVLPMLLFAWLGYRILASAKIPPARMKLPFTVPLIKGKNARMVGILILTLSLFLISQDLVYLAQKITQ